MTENRRIQALQARLDDEMDGVLIESPVTRRYFTRFPSSAGYLLVSRDKAIFLTDSRYIEEAGRAVTGCEVRLFDGTARCLSTAARELGARRLGLESARVTLRQLRSLEEKLPVPLDTSGRLDGILFELRRCKEEEEIAKIKEAQAITDAAYEHILGFIREGVSQRDIALELDFFMRRQGAERSAFDTIVVSGRDTSMPHGVPCGHTVSQGDFITMDFGCVVDGYHSDMTRTVAFGRPNDEQIHIYETVLRAQQAALDAVRAGVLCREVDKAARDVIERAGFGGYFGHSTGHSVGLEIHESPNFAPNSQDTALPGMVVSVEPGVYLPGKYGVRIEDLIVVTRDGCENLTKSPKSLKIL